VKRTLIGVAAVSEWGRRHHESEKGETNGCQMAQQEAEIVTFSADG